MVLSVTLGIFSGAALSFVVCFLFSYLWRFMGRRWFPPRPPDDNWEVSPPPSIPSSPSAVSLPVSQAVLAEFMEDSPPLPPAAPRSLLLGAPAPLGRGRVTALEILRGAVALEQAPEVLRSAAASDAESV